MRGDACGCSALGQDAWHRPRHVFADLLRLARCVCVCARATATAATHLLCGHTLNPLPRRGREQRADRQGPRTLTQPDASALCRLRAGVQEWTLALPRIDTAMQTTPAARLCCRGHGAQDLRDQACDGQGDGEGPFAARTWCARDVACQVSSPDSDQERLSDRETERQRDREGERETDRETERQRDRETERQRNRETEAATERASESNTATPSPCDAARSWPFSKHAGV